LAFILLNLPSLTDIHHPTAHPTEAMPTCSGSPPAAAKPKLTWA
jgi:hypothetical protein